MHAQPRPSATARRSATPSPTPSCAPARPTDLRAPRPRRRARDPRRPPLRPLPRPPLRRASPRPLDRRVAHPPRRLGTPTRTLRARRSRRASSSNRSARRLRRRSGALAPRRSRRTDAGDPGAVRASPVLRTPTVRPGGLSALERVLPSAYGIGRRSRAERPRPLRRSGRVTMSARAPAGQRSAARRVLVRHGEAGVRQSPAAEVRRHPVPWLCAGRQTLVRTHMQLDGSSRNRHSRFGPDASVLGVDVATAMPHRAPVVAALARRNRRRRSPRAGPVQLERAPRCSGMRPAEPAEREIDAPPQDRLLRRDGVVRIRCAGPR